jgi:predicted nuclease of predicted toxin-antitoxin system
VARRPKRPVRLRLLLDEHLSPEIARQLRHLGHDVIAVGERPDLRGRADRVHFAALSEEQRAIVTRDLGDFRPLLAEALRRGTPTYGIVCVPHGFPLTRQDIGRLVRALAALLDANAEPDAIIKQGGEIWLEDPAAEGS